MRNSRFLLCSDVGHILGTCGQVSCGLRRRGRGYRCGESNYVLEAGFLEAVHVVCHHEFDRLGAGGGGLGYDDAQGRVFEGVGDGSGDKGAVEGLVSIQLMGRNKAF